MGTPGMKLPRARNRSMARGRGTPKAPSADVEHRGPVEVTILKPKRKAPISQAARNRLTPKRDAKAAAPAKQPTKAVATVRSYSVDLQLRHAQWVEDQARLTRTTAAKIIEQCVRLTYAADPNKAGRSGGASMTRTEFVEAQQAGGDFSRGRTRAPDPEDDDEDNDAD